MEITRENATPFAEVYAALEGALGNMKIARTAYMRWTERDNEIGQARDAVTRAIALLKDIERTAEEAN